MGSRGVCIICFIKVRELNIQLSFLCTKLGGKGMNLSGFDITTVVGNVWYVALGFILFDVVTGLLAAGAERKINSSINFIGIIRKVGLFVALAFVVFIDAYLGSQGYIIKLGVGMIVAYEGLSIIENFSRIGIDVKFLTKFFDKSKVGKGRGK
jgi:toxin secretion/phage lysis holin